MHIVLTVNAAWNIANFRKAIVSDLVEQGHRVTVLAPPDEAVEALKEMGCDFVPLEMDVKGLSPLHGFRLVGRMRQHFRTIRPDIVLSYTIKNNIFGALAAKPLGVPFLPNVTGLGTAFLSGGPIRAVAEALYRLSFRHLPVVFFQNADDRALFLERRLVAPDRARLLPGSGIDLDRFAFRSLPAENDGVTFLMIARLLRDKGVVEYAQAARLVRTDYPSARFQLLGPVGVENRTAITSAELAGWQREGAIEYLGSVSDVRSKISDADCVVLPSYREGAPRTLIEAAAMGRPLIATDVPGCRQVVRRGKSGFLCEPQDSESLAEACRMMIEQGGPGRAEMGRAARQHMASEYDEAIVAQAYLGAIQELTDETG